MFYSQICREIVKQVLIIVVPALIYASASIYVLHRDKGGIFPNDEIEPGPSCLEILCVRENAHKGDYPAHCYSPNSKFDEIHCRYLRDKPKFTVNETVVIGVMQDNHWERIDKNFFSGLWSLRSLDLTGNNISTIENNALEKMKRLENLVLRSNKLTQIPTANLPDLRFLNMHKNRVTKIDLKRIEHSKKLKHLTLSSNNIISIAKEAFTYTKKLENLILMDNKISSIDASAFSGLEKLKNLFLSGNKLSTLNNGTFSSLVNLQELHLDRNELKSFEPNQFFVSFLSLSHNSIVKFDTKIFRKFPAELDLLGNPLDCSMVSKLQYKNSTIHYPSGNDCFPTTPRPDEVSGTTTISAASTERDLCGRNPCKNNGTCSQDGEEIYCFCTNAFEGEDCNTDHDECKHKPCKNDGFCQNYHGTFTCTCRKGWKGKLCNIQRVVVRDSIAFTSLLAFVLTSIFVVGLLATIWWRRVSNKERGLLAKLVQDETQDHMEASRKLRSGKKSRRLSRNSTKLRQSRNTSSRSMQKMRPSRKSKQ